MSSNRRWIEKNGQSLKIPTGVNSLLRPWNLARGLYSTRYRRELLTNRPKVHGYKSVRVCKDMVYSEVIRDHLDKYGVFGDYLGLAAAHGPEIYAALYPHITKQFTTCQISRKDYILLSDFVEEMDWAYSRTACEMLHGNILDWMGRLTEVAIIDLDMMVQLSEKLLERVIYGLEHCAVDKSTVALWHSVNREPGGGDHLIDERYMPMLKEGLRTGFKVLKHDRIKYYEDQGTYNSGYPMRVEVLTLERKWKKESRAA